MARHISVIVLLAVAFFVVLSFMNAFGGDRTDKAPPSLEPVSFSGVSADSASDWKGSPGGSKDTVPNLKPQAPEFADAEGMNVASISSNILSGGSIAPKLENATIKAELGRASWKLFHTMMARFPEQPSDDDSLALKTYIQLFARLYPCGDCASHFRKLLAEFPPQTSSRNAAAGWACFVHNQVNERLRKPLFDCNDIGDFYDCGCGEEEKKGAAGELKLEKDW